MNSRWLKAQNVKGETLKLIGKNMTLGWKKFFLNKTV